LEHGLQEGPGPGQLGVQDDDGGSHGVAPPQLLYEVVEALFSATNDHMVCQLSNLFSASHLQWKCHTDEAHINGSSNQSVCLYGRITQWIDKSTNKQTFVYVFF